MNWISDYIQRWVPTYDYESIASILGQPILVVENLFKVKSICWIQRRQLGVRYQTWLSRDPNGNDIRLFSPIGVLKFLPLLVGGGYLTPGDLLYLLTRPHLLQLSDGVLLDFLSNVMLYEFMKQRDSIRYGWSSYRRFLKLYR